MTGSRNFGLIKSGRPVNSGAQINRPSVSRGAREPSNVYPFPKGSILPDPLAEVERGRVADRAFIIVFSLLFFVPLILAGVMIHYR